jgi:ligand-binding sensor domain-containing protein
MPRYLIIILFVLAMPDSGGAQSTSYSVTAQSFDETNFTRYTVKDGMSDNNVNCLQQDEWGYVWIGTDAGLNRFDGHAFRNFSLFPESLPLLSGTISRIKLFGQHELGIISHGGFQLINTEHFSWQNYLIPDSTVFTSYRNVAWDAVKVQGSSFAVTTASGFYVFNESGKVNFRQDAYQPGDIGNKRILYGRDIFRLNDKEYLIYVEENKLALYNDEEKKFREIDPSEKEWEEFYAPYAPGGELWGSKYQLNDHEYIFINIEKSHIEFYDRRLKRMISSPLPFHATQELSWKSKITMLDSGCFVLNCSNYGFYLFHIDRQTGIITCNPAKFLPSHEITCLFFDKERRLWAGTPNGLLQQRLKAPFLHSYPFKPTSKKSVYTESFSCAYAYKDRLYTGHYSRNAGLVILDAATMKVGKQIHFYGEDNMWNEIISIQMYYADTLWLGTNGGILWFDTKTNHYGQVLKKLGNIPDGIVDKIRYRPREAMLINLAPASKDGYAWMAFGLQGIVGRYEIASRAITFFTPDTKPALPFSKIKQIVYDAYGDVWVSGHSLARWNSRSQLFDTLINVYGGPKKFNSNIITISADDSGSLWLYIEENGLLQYKIKEKKFTAYGPKDGLPSNMFECFSPVINHILWLANSTSLTSFDTRTKKTSVYDYSDGLSSYKPTSRRIYYDSVSRLFYLFCGNDLVKFPLSSPAANYHSSDILIEQVEINNRRTMLQPGDGMRLSPDSNNLSINFAIVDFEAGNGYSFAYKLNKAETWTDLGHARNLALNGLSPGKYLVQLKATGKSGLQKLKEFSFVIRPRFWQTTWFILLVAAAIIATLYVLYRIRIRQIRQKANIDKQLAQMEMKALHAQMNPHFIFNSLNSIKEMVLNNENSEASNYLSKFAQMIRITLDQSVHTFVTLRSTVDYLNRYIEMEKIRNCHFSCTITVDPALDQDELILPPMLIQPFIENSIWHGIVPPQKGIHIQVAFRQTAKQLICTVEDDGVGIDRSVAGKKTKSLSDHAYGIGNVRERIRLLNEKYDLQSKVRIIDKSKSGQNTTGTVVTLELQMQIPDA